MSALQSGRQSAPPSALRNELPPKLHNELPTKLPTRFPSKAPADLPEKTPKLLRNQTPRPHVAILSLISYVPADDSRRDVGAGLSTCTYDRGTLLRRAEPAPTSVAASSPQSAADHQRHALSPAELRQSAERGIRMPNGNSAFGTTMATAFPRTMSSPCDGSSARPSRDMSPRKRRWALTLGRPRSSAGSFQRFSGRCSRSLRATTTVSRA